MNYARNMPDTLTYWAPTGRNEYNEVTFAAPVTLACRWQDVAKLFRDSEGTELMSTAIVYPAEPLLREGWIYQGTSAEVDPRQVVGAHEIKQIGQSGNLAGTLRLNKVWLA